MFTLALIESDATHRRALRSLLEAEEFRVHTYETAGMALNAVRAASFDVCVLDLDLPDADGIAVCGTIRREKPRMPVIASTERYEEFRCVEALLAGADDVVPKPVSGRELLARIRAVLRRSGKQRSGPTYQDDQLTVLIDEMRVVVRDRPVPLSLGETRVLALLIRESPAPVSVTRIHRELATGDAEIKRGTIEARIKSLRRKLGKDRIETRAQFGYVFVHWPDNAK